VRLPWHGRCKGDLTVADMVLCECAHAARSDYEKSSPSNGECKMVAKILVIHEDDYSEEFKAASKLASNEKFKNCWLTRNPTSEELLLREEYNAIWHCVPKAKNHSEKEKMQKLLLLSEEFHKNLPLSNESWCHGEIRFITNFQIVGINHHHFYDDGLSDDYIDITFYNSETEKFEKSSIKVNYTNFSKYQKDKFYTDSTTRIEYDADEEVANKYKACLFAEQMKRRADEIETNEYQSRLHYLNQDHTMYFTKEAKRGKNPFEKNLMGRSIYEGSSDYGSYNILKFTNSNIFVKDPSVTLLTPTSKLREYIPSIELLDNDIDPSFGFLGKNFVEYVFRSLFIKDGLDLRNYPYEVFDKSICAGLEYLITDQNLINFSSTEFYSFKIRKYSEFETHILSTWKELLDKALQIVDNSLQENLEEFNREKKEREELAATKQKKGKSK